MDRIERTEGGQGGRLGLRRMDHWDLTANIKDENRGRRRRQDRAHIEDQLAGADLDDAVIPNGPGRP